jgi:hypothetical protein
MTADLAAPQPDLDTLLRLEDAIKFAFPFGGMTVSGLRRERDRDNLVIVKMANKDFTTLRDIQQMREKCREQQSPRDCGLSPKSVTRRASSSGKLPGSFETERTRSALAALEQTARALSKPSLNTLPRNTLSREIADVILLKS